MLDTLLIVGRVAVVMLGLTGGAISILAAYNSYNVSRKKKALLADELSSRFIKQFGKKELASHLISYIVPHCSPSDPSNKEGEEFLAELEAEDLAETEAGS